MVAFLSQFTPIMQALLATLFTGFVTAMGALVYKLVDFLKGADYMLAAIAVVLVCLGLFVAYQGAARLRATLRGRPHQSAPSSGPPEESAVSQ